MARIMHFHAKAKRIMEDFARKVEKWVVKVAKDFVVDVIKLENLRNMIKLVKGLPSEFRDRLYLMQYRRIQYWVE